MVTKAHVSLLHVLKLAFLIALVIGFVLGLVGSGGSIITMPVLVYLFDIKPVAATTYSLFIVGTAAFAGTVQNHFKGNVNWRSTLWFGGASIATVLIVRRFVLHKLPEVVCLGEFCFDRDRALMLLFAALMLMVSYTMLRVNAETTGSASRPQLGMLVFSGALVGVLTGLVGIGGGFLIVPALTLYAGLPVKQSIGTSLSIITVNSFSGFASDVSYVRNIDWLFLVVFTGLAVIGISVGTLLSRRTPSASLKKMFAVFVIAMAVYMLYREFYAAQ